MSAERGTAAGDASPAIGNGTHGARASDRAPAPREEDALDPLFQVRTADVEPFTGLRYLAKLFRFVALILVLMLVAEVVSALGAGGPGTLPRLIGEVSRLVVLAAVLWGVGDLALLLVDVGHDVRATRVMLGREAARALGEHGRREDGSATRL
jgi:hypothetical protein